jgi:hypothetical protein
MISAIVLKEISGFPPTTAFDQHANMPVSILDTDLYKVRSPYLPRPLSLRQPSGR